MFKRKCPGCANKIEKKFNFCPWCGHSIKSHRENEDFGLLGMSDNTHKNIPSQNMPITGLPFGLEKMMGPLIKQLEKELSNLDKENNSSQNFPKGFNIRIQTGMPNELRQESGENKFKNSQKSMPKISEEETKRRQTLPKKEAKSKVKRLSDKIIYEIDAPGIKEKRDVSITHLEKGFEIKAYTKSNCYVKTIPLEMEIEDYLIKNNKLILEFKN